VKRAWWQFGRREDELSEEIESHIAMAIQERVARGESLDSATAAARRQFGNREVVRGTARDMWGFIWLEQIVLDFRYAIRKLRLAPGFTAAATVSLAIGIGATVTMFAVVDTADIRALPYPDADHLVAIEETGTMTSGNGHGRVFPEGTSPDAIDAWRRSTTFSAMSVVTNREVYWSQTADENERLILPEVGAEFFSLLGSNAIIGRTIAPSDTSADAPGALVLSYRFWSERFARDRGVLGRIVQLSRTEATTAPRETYTIIGVMAPEVDYPGGANGWIAYRSGQMTNGNGSINGVSHVLARLRTGQTVQSASAELNGIANALPATNPNATRGVQVNSLRAQLRSEQPNDPVAMDSSKGRAVRFGVVLFVLLIAVINVGNLLLARTAYRDHEIAVRTALGASRARLAQQILVEGATVAVFGGVAGLVLAWWGTRYTASIGDFARMGIVPAIDARVTVFAVALSVATAIGIGFIPIVSIIRSGTGASAEQSSRTTASRARARVSGVLLIGQIAGALTLLTGGGLLAKELLRIASRGYDFDPTNIVEFPNSHLGAGPAGREAFRASVFSRLQRIPGVQSVSDFEICGCSGFFPLGEKQKMASYFLSALAVDSGFLKNLKIPLRRGRDFASADFAAAAPVAIVSAATAERFWPGADPIGREVVVAPGPPLRGEPKPDSLHLTVIGVMANPNLMGTLKEPPLLVIHPHTGANGLDNFIVRVTADSAATIAAIRHTFSELRGAPLTKGSYEGAQWVIDKQLAEQRLTTRALLAFAAVALLLATLGIHGLVAFAVAQRTREIGIRMALGAEAKSVLLLVTKRGLILAAAGILLGVAGALAMTNGLSAMLYGTSPTDPAVFVGSALLLATVVLIASYLPARRATRVDPMVALRVD
jgi:putative ABC transport system permease protein